MIYEMVLPINDAAAKKMFRVGRDVTLFLLVGTVTTEVVDIQIPTVEEPDETNDAHWTTIMQEGSAVTLNVDHNVVWLPSAQQLIRLNKAAGVAANAYGVRRC